MRPLLAALALLALCTGCVSTHSDGTKRRLKGDWVAKEYFPWSGLDESEGCVAVVFAKGSPTPPTHWWLLGAGKAMPRPLRVGTDPDDSYACLRYNRHAMMFALDPRYAHHHPQDTAPEPRMVTVMEKQRLVVTIKYKKAWKKSDRASTAPQNLH